MADQPPKPNDKSLDLQARFLKALEKVEPNKEKREKILVSLFSATFEAFSGPIPSPDTLRKYEEVLPGLAERIVKMAENQNSHRINLEDTVVTSQQKESRRGQHYGLLIGILGLATCVILSLSGHDAVATAIGSTTIVGLVTVFVVGKRQQRRDLARKALPPGSSPTTPSPTA